MMSRLHRLFKRTPNRVIFHISCVSAVLISLLSFLLAALGAEKPPYNMGTYTAVHYSLMALAMLLAWKSAPQGRSLAELRTLLVIAVFIRLILVGSAPYTSNDVNRYLFDGRIAIEGVDPYRVSHDAPALAQLREQWQPPSEHAKYVTLYPPVSLALFALAASTGLDNALMTWKLMLLVASMAILWFGAHVLQHAGKLHHLPLLALSPLLLFESAIGLHVDTFSALAVVMAIYFWQRQAVLLTAVAIGVGTAIKLVPIMLILPLVFTFPNVKIATRFIATVFSTIIALYAITLLLGFHPVGSIAVFFEKWRFAAPLFVVLDQWFDGQQILIIMLLLAGGITLSLAAWLWNKQKHMPVGISSIALAGQIALSVPLLISPVVFPWYLLPLVPLMALHPNRYVLGWSVLMPLTYEVLNGFLSVGQWQPALWPIWLVGLIQLTAVMAILGYGLRLFAGQIFTANAR